MRMTVTKVKPVVVKHVLNNQVMSIYELKVRTRLHALTLRAIDTYGEGPS